MQLEGNMQEEGTKERKLNAIEDPISPLDIINSRISNLFASGDAQKMLSTQRHFHQTYKFKREIRNKSSNVGEEVLSNIGRKEEVCKIEKRRAFELLVPGMIVLVRVEAYREVKLGKECKTQILRVLSYLDTFKTTSKIQQTMEEIGVYHTFNYLAKYNIIGLLSPNDVSIPENRMSQQMNLMDGENITEGTEIQALISHKAKTPTLGWHFVLSVKNSLLSKHTQTVIVTPKTIFPAYYSLGIQREPPTNPLIQSSKSQSSLEAEILNDNKVHHLRALRNIIDNLGINEYASLNLKSVGKNTYNSINFTYDKFREIQNLDWAEECVNVGVRMCENSTPQAALEYFDNAIQLDILNKEAYYWKALALTRIGDKAGALESIDKGLGLDPHWEIANELKQKLEEKNNHESKAEKPIKDGENFKYEFEIPMEQNIFP